MHLSSASADFQRQQGFYRRCFPIGRTSPFLFAWLLFLKSRQFAYVKRKSTDKCAIGGGRNHRLSLQHGLAPGLSSPRKAGQQAQKRPGMAYIFVTCAAVLSKDLQNVRFCVIISSRNAKQEILYYAAPRGSKQPAFPASVLCGAGAFLCKRSPYAFIRKNKRAFPPPHGAGWP